MMTIDRRLAEGDRPDRVGGPRRRALRMAVAWSLLGAVVGAAIGAKSGDPAGVLAHVIAGLIEMPALGALLGLLGGRAGESLLGAACGLLVGAALGGSGGDGRGLELAVFGLFVGGLAGATARPYLRLVASAWALTALLLRSGMATVGIGLARPR